MALKTIKDIARELNLSPSTVSRALSNHQDISEATREKVTELARRYNYRPNLVARNLKARESRTIGVLVPSINDNFFSTVISGIEDVAYRSGYYIMVSQSNEDYHREVFNTGAMMANQVAGVICAVSQTTMARDHFTAMKRANIPLVFFDRVIDDLDASRVTVNDEAGAAEVTEHLISRGYRDIVHLAGPGHISTAIERLKGFQRTLERHTIPVGESSVITGGFQEVDGYRSMDLMIQRGQVPDAVFAVNDPVAMGAIRRIKEEGLSIPGDIAVAGFNNDPVTACIDPPLTTVEQPALEIGHTAAELMLEHIQSDNSLLSTVTKKLNTRLIVREST